MFDTHAHLNFLAFQDNLDEVISQARESGIKQIVVPSSNIETSQKAIEIAQKYEGIYAAVGIHPFHLYGHLVHNKSVDEDLEELEKLLKEEKVVAIGEVGLDRNPYKSKKYPDYEISEELLNLQKEVFIAQIKLAIKYKKSLIIHNRAAGEETVQILQKEWNPHLSGRTVFHLCEADEKLLEFAKTHEIYISIGGNVTFNPIQQDFAKKIPLKLLVLETDSPYILPEPLKSNGVTFNQPANLIITLNFLSALLKNDNLEEVIYKNSCKLFNL